MSTVYQLAAEVAAALKKHITVLPEGVKMHRGIDPVTGQPVHFRWKPLEPKKPVERKITAIEVLRNLGRDF